MFQNLALEILRDFKSSFSRYINRLNPSSLSFWMQSGKNKNWSEEAFVHWFSDSFFRLKWFHIIVTDFSKRVSDLFHCFLCRSTFNKAMETETKLGKCCATKLKLGNNYFHKIQFAVGHIFFSLFSAFFRMSAKCIILSWWVNQSIAAYYTIDLWVQDTPF